MLRAAIALIIVSMPSGDAAETWLEKGAEAYAKMRMAEAGQDFEKAVAANPNSARAHLSLGVIRLFQYLNGIAEPDTEMHLALEGGEPTSEQWQTWTEKKKQKIAEQNGTNAASAEEHIRRALELEPHDQQAMEYMASLYFWWRDPSTETAARLDEAKHWYERLLEINPQHRFANYMCGLVGYETAFRIIRTKTGFPRPLTDQDRRRSLRAEAGPLLTESAQNFRRALEIEPTHRDPVTYLALIKADQAYIAETEEEAARDRAEADALKQRVHQMMEAEAKASGQPWPPGDKASITFERVPERSGGGAQPVPRFPPDTWIGMVPIAPALPVPPPPASPSAK